MKYYKMMFMTMIFMSTMISISSNSWLMMWIGLEINLLSIMPIMNMNKNILSSESSIKYFMTQVMASKIIMMSIVLMMWKFNTSSSMFYKSNLLMIMNSSFLMKMGMAPFHFWFPEVIEGQSWNNCLLLLTWQKLTPMILFMINNSMMIFISMVIMSSMIVSGIMGINQTSLRKIMAYSSINHMGWMMSTMMMSKTIWLMYFVVYSTISVSLITMFIKNKLNFIKQIFNKMGKSQMNKILFSMNFFSIMGLPPFMGFLPKWLSIQALIVNNMYMITIMMMMSTMVMMFTYMRITIQFLMMKINIKNWKNMENENNMFYMMMTMISVFSMPMITVTFNIM
uniref:NADH-ubiquinone oxidoreductase chain 2 n=1 Tax=Stenocladius sp. FM17 TaxID=2596692 RepID=A0A5C0PWH8_9COLE|nr:NADH dehydrogenase subunit 2 [Stenocladius sp. FM17]